MSPDQEAVGQQTTPRTTLFSELRQINHESLHEFFDSYIRRIFDKVGFVGATIALILPPILMMTIGGVFRLDCPRHNYIPVYLIISGIISIIALFWIVISQLDSRFVTQLDYYVNVHQLQFFFTVILFIWCILGGYFVLSILVPTATDCQPILYYFALFIVASQIVLFVHIFAFFLCTCCACFKDCCSPKDPEETPA